MSTTTTATTQDAATSTQEDTTAILSPTTPTTPTQEDTTATTASIDNPTPKKTAKKPAKPAKKPATPPQDDAAKDAARAGYEKRMREKRLDITRSNMTTAQKETARALIDRAGDTVNTRATEDDKTILTFDALLLAGDKHARATVPSAYLTRPVWLDAKTWEKAKRAFATAYVTHGASHFEKDHEGRLIMPLPMTAGRYMGAVVTGDIKTILTYAGGWRASHSGTFYMLASMDGVAPIVSAVYRSGALLNMAEAKLDKLQAKLDGLGSDADSYTATMSKRDAARTSLAAAREAFIAAYTAAIADADITRVQAQDAFLALHAAVESPADGDAAVK